MLLPVYRVFLCLSNNKQIEGRSLVQSTQVVLTANIPGLGGETGGSDLWALLAENCFAPKNTDCILTWRKAERIPAIFSGTVSLVV